MHERFDLYAESVLIENDGFNRKKGEPMNRKQVRLLSLACLFALSANSLTVLAQVSVKRTEPGAQERTVWVEKQVEGGQAVVHVLGPEDSPPTP